ncbi:MAG: efflux RND transporter periplasmic adaptor subunit [Gammaproteobacteria bacterium]|nr:efflux RND transporter periplasmic adaptor subunit [Gammaproteobacteria bacterium]
MSVRSRSTRNLLCGGILLLGAVQSAAQEQGGFALPVEAETLEAGLLEWKVEAVGDLRANESIVLRPEIDGRITAIEFREGERVTRGEVLVRLDESIYNAELLQAEARLALGQTNYTRANSLKKQGYGSDQEKDRTASELRVNRAEVALAQARLAKTRLLAPFDGVLGLRKVSEGDYVQPGTDLVSLLDLSVLKVDFRIPEIHVSRVRVGQLIRVTLDAYPGKHFEGRVYAIDPQVDLNGRSLLLRARIPNEEGVLRAGLFARVELVLASDHEAITVPETALVPQGDKQFVYKVVDGKVVWTEVERGLRQGRRVEVRQGLKAGDQVVTAGHLKIHDGMAVTVLPAKAKGS